MQDTFNTSATDVFPGFEHYSANFVFCPNQFLDHCVMHYERGVVRLVGHVLHQTLRCLDEEGKPVQQDIAVSMNTSISQAGVSRGGVRPALDASLAARFITCTQFPEKKSIGKAGRVGEYSLLWAADAPDPDSFSGFYSGKGHRTVVPHAFFTHVLPYESLAVIRVVAAIIRYTVGYENQFGGRRLKHALSYSDLESITGLSRKHVWKAVKHAIAMNYIEAETQERSTTVYALKWLSKEEKQRISSKRKLATTPSQSVQKGNQEAFKKETTISSKTSTNGFKKETPLKERNNPEKKQQPVAETCKVYQALIEIGFDRQVASDLVAAHDEKVIVDQLKWLKVRRADRNALGMLRTAIEQNWSPPATTLKTPSVHRPGKTNSARSLSSTRRSDRMQQRGTLLQTWLALPPEKRRQYHQVAISKATSLSTRLRLQRHRDLLNPPTEVLTVMARSQTP